MDKKIVYTIIGLLLILLIIIQIIFFYIKKVKSIPPDSGSIQRVQTIGQLFRSYLGNMWPVVLTLIILLILVILILMYFITEKNVNIVVESKFLSIMMITFFIVATAASVIAVYNIYVSNRPNPDNLTDNEKKILDQQQNVIKSFVTIIAMILALFLILGGGLWAIKKLKSHQ